MPDLSISRQDIMAKQLVAKKQQQQQQQQAPPTSCIGGVEFHHDNQKMTVANSLFQTVIKGNINKVRHILARGVNVNVKNDYGFSPLVAALHIEDSHKRARMFQLLIEKGAWTKAKDACKTTRSVLHWACVLGQVEQVSCLLEETAGDINLNEKDADGLTALHHAVKIGNLAIVDLLVDFYVRFGVTVDAVDDMGLTPYGHARRLGYRDVATVLKIKGLASTGHGDHLFRSPREWSQIGKFERKKAIVLENQDRINAFKIMGRANMIPLLENSIYNSPRMAIPGIAMPSYRPADDITLGSNGHHQNIPLSKRKPPHHLSSSLPSLSQAVGMDGSSGADAHRPFSASRQDKVQAGGGGDTNDNDNDYRPGPPMVAFTDKQAVDSDSSFQSISTNNKTIQNSGIINSRVANANNMMMTSSSTKKVNSEATTTTASYVTIPTGIITNSTHSQGFANYSSSTNSKSRMQASTTGRQFRSDSKMAAFDLLQQQTKGRMANNFHHSEFDKSKASEYKQMLGNLNSIMDVLSQQQTKSFRKSVQVKKPETPPKVKKKNNKVSTLAIIFGSDGRKRSSRKKKSASPSNSKGSKSDKGKRGKSPKQSKKGEGSSKPKPAVENANRLPVPTIKIN